MCYTILLSPLAVYRKSGYSMGALYSRKKGTSLTRKPSFTSRPFLHQYEVRGTYIPPVSTSSSPPPPPHILPSLTHVTETHRPAPTTPVKTHSCGFRRNLSFGATTTTTKPPSCVLARPCKLRLLEYGMCQERIRTGGRLE